MMTKTAMVCAAWSLLNLTAAFAHAEVQSSESNIETPFATTGPHSLRPAYLQVAQAYFSAPHTKIGQLSYGENCTLKEDLVWNKKLYGTFSNQLPKAFRAVLQTAGFPVPMPVSASNAVQYSALYVHTALKDVQANFCASEDGVSGQVFMKTVWQVYSPETKQLIFEGTTEGAFQASATTEMPVTYFFEQAFAAASKSLLANPGFYKAVIVEPSFPHSSQSSLK